LQTTIPVDTGPEQTHTVTVGEGSPLPDHCVRVLAGCIVEHEQGAPLISIDVSSGGVQRDLTVCVDDGEGACSNPDGVHTTGLRHDPDSPTNLPKVRNGSGARADPCSTLSGVAEATGGALVVPPYVIALLAARGLCPEGES
jgi:hypothetical protein